MKANEHSVEQSLCGNKQLVATQSQSPTLSFALWARSLDFLQTMSVQSS